MSGYVEWIAAQAEDDDPAKGALDMPVQTQWERQSPGELSAIGDSWRRLPVHNFPAVPDEGWRQDDSLDRNPDLWLYRSRTVALLHRYLRFSLETGRLPSIVGKEFFRAKVTSYRSVTFEDRVIFVRDVEKVLSRREHWDQQLIARIILQEHSHEKAARLLHCCRKTIARRLPEVLDLLSEDFLEVGLLVALPPRGRRR